MKGNGCNTCIFCTYLAGGGPFLRSATMSDRRLEFIEQYDWIRTGLCFEPRGHAQMSGGFIFPPTAGDTDFGILFIETSGCLPMCGHGTIGIVTFALEHGLVRPGSEGVLRVEVPAGVLDVSYTRSDNRVTAVRIRSVPSYVAAQHSHRSAGLRTVDGGRGLRRQFLRDHRTAGTVHRPRFAP
jgi:4-hydroxyproline epimerase